MMNSAVPQIVQLTHAEHRGLDQSINSEIKSGLIIPLHPLVCSDHRIVVVTEIDELDRDLHRVVHVLHRLAVDLEHFEQGRLKLPCDRRVSLRSRSTSRTPRTRRSALSKSAPSARVAAQTRSHAARRREETALRPKLEWAVA